MRLSLSLFYQITKKGKNSQPGDRVQSQKNLSTMKIKMDAADKLAAIVVAIICMVIFLIFLVQYFVSLVFKILSL